MSTYLNQSTGSRLNEIVFFKAICIAAVLAVHSTSDAIANIDPQATSYSIFVFVNRLFAFGTPLLIMISGFLYFYAYWSRNFKEIDWERYWVKRVLYILVPYIVFSLVYYFIKNLWLYPTDADWTKHLRMIWAYLKNGRAHPHLYFFMVIIQTYVAFPVILYLFKKIPRIFTYAVPIGLAVHIGFLILNNKVQFVNEKGSLLISYLSFYILGAWLGANYSKFKEFFQSPFRSWVGYVGFSVIVAAVALFGFLFADAWRGVLTGAFKSKTLYLEFYYIMFIIPTSLLILYISNLISNNKKGIVKKGVKIIGIYSFGIYLIHPLFLMFYRLHVPNGSTLTEYIIWLAGSYIVAMVGSIIIVHLIVKFVPIYRYIVGNV